MPILYSIVFLAMLSTYITDRIAVCYFYREPPQYDETVTLTALKYIKFMTVLSLPCAYWQLCNRQVFSNQHVPDLSTRQIMPTDATLWHALKTSNPFTNHLTYYHGPILLFYALICFYVLKHARNFFKRRKRTEIDDLSERKDQELF